MTYPEFEKDRRLQEAAAEYTAKFGGVFWRRGARRPSYVRPGR